MYNKQIFFVLSSIVVCMPIAGMKYDEQKNTLMALPKEMIYKTTQYCDLQSILRLKRINKALSNYDTIELICSSHKENNHVCSSVVLSKIIKREPELDAMGLLIYLENNKTVRESHSTLMNQLLRPLTHRQVDLLVKYGTSMEKWTKSIRPKSIAYRLYSFDNSDKSFEIKSSLIRRGYINLNKVMGLSLLEHACHQGQVDFVKLLIEKGVDIHAKACLSEGSLLDIMKKEVYCMDNGSIVSKESPFKELVESLSFLDTHPLFIRHATLASLLALGVGGIGYCLFNKIFNH